MKAFGFTALLALAACVKPDQIPPPSPDQITAAAEAAKLIMSLW